ncbi:MAG: hypothetical protein ACON3Z_12890 [Bradymonadia bacterium]
MNAKQGNTPPTWLGRSRLRLLFDVVGGWRQNWSKFVEVLRMFSAMARPTQVRLRLERLQSFGHCDVVPTMSQLLVASRDQLSFSLGADTKEFYKSQGVPWVFHNVRRFIAYPTTMMDPVGFFSSRDTIIQHVLQTFHRHATYDLVLLRSHEDGLAEMQKQLKQLAEGAHLHQRSLDSLVEDGSYHDRLRRDVSEFIDNPLVQARPIPDGLVDNQHLMLAMDQFKDIRGYTNYAARLKAGPWQVFVAFMQMAFNETLGELINMTVGPKTVNVDACEPEFVSRHLG